VFKTHSGNLGKYFLKLLEYLVNSYVSNPSTTSTTLHSSKDKVYSATRTGEMRPITIKLESQQETNCLNGGKIVEKAKVFGNAKNMLNSIRLNNANQWPNNIHKRNLSTDSKNRETLTLSGSNKISLAENVNEIHWNSNKWSKLESYVYKQQVKLTKLAGMLGSGHLSIKKLQIQLAKSLSFRLVAVHRVSTNSGAKTPGLDKILLNSDSDKMLMVKTLKILLIEAEKGHFKSSPVKRVMIPKGNGKLRPLGIPTMQDRCLQALIKLILEPIVEMNSDSNSYGFRPHRGAKNAIAAVRTLLQSGQESKWVLDADIKSFFDEINHNWLLLNLPLSKAHKLIVEKWLKSGAVLDGELTDTESGTPQGGIISPVLANFTLNGLEDHVRNSISSISGGKHLRKNIYQNGVRTKLLSFNLKTVRYADDFVVIGRSKRNIEQFVKPAVSEFLAERGLRLSPDNTKIFQMASGTELKFLGYVFKYRDVWSKKYSFFKDRIGQSGIALYPDKEKVKSIIGKLKLIIDNSQNLTSYQLIAKLNPIIRGWSLYFNMGESYIFRGYVRFALFKIIWNWIHKKHPKWGKGTIARYYFTGEDQRKHRLGINTKWNFYGRVRGERRHSIKQGAIT
jgi:RNA-directed DNA polymerase